MELQVHADRYQTLSVHTHRHLVFICVYPWLKGGTYEPESPNIRTCVGKGHHRAARGKPVLDAENEHLPEYLGSFAKFLDCEVPPFLHPPDTSARRERLGKARSEALARLSTLFEHLFQTQPGEP